MYLNDDFAARQEYGGECILDKLFGEGKAEERSENPCGIGGCGVGDGDTSWGLKNYPLAMVYSVLQDFDELYDKETALERGTIFKGLDLPFLGGSGGQCNICGGSKNG